MEKKFEKLLEEFKDNKLNNLQAIKDITIDYRFVRPSLNFYVDIKDEDRNVLDRCAHYDYEVEKECYEMFVVDKDDAMIKTDLECVMKRLEGF